MSATGVGEWPPVVRHVILDRDGVLNVERPSPVCSVAEWEWLPGVRDGLAALGETGAVVSVATNQSAIGRGLVDTADVDSLHRWVVGEMERLGVRVVGVFVCPHVDGDGCGCRKPAPGLVSAAVEASGLPARDAILVGDDLRDLRAARAAGVAAALVRTGKGARVESAGGAGGSVVSTVRVFDDLAAVVDRLRTRVG